MMKIVTYVAIALLVVTLGAAGILYVTAYKPMTDELAKMKSSMAELDKAKGELAKYKEKEAKDTLESAWVNQMAEAFIAGLASETKSGKIEVFPIGNKVVVNISEELLYLDGTYTFAQESPALRAKIAALLKQEKLKGKDIYIGNTTAAVPAQSKGRKKIPGKDARNLAAERSAALIKDLVEKNGVNQDMLIAAAYSEKKPEAGIKLKERKTVIVIENTPQMAVKKETAPTPQQTPATKATTTAAAATKITTTIQPAAPPAQATPINRQPAQPATK